MEESKYLTADTQVEMPVVETGIETKEEAQDCTTRKSKTEVLVLSKDTVAVTQTASIDNYSLNEMQLDVHMNSGIQSKVDVNVTETSVVEQRVNIEVQSIVDVNITETTDVESSFTEMKDKEVLQEDVGNDINISNSHDYSNDFSHNSASLKLTKVDMNLSSYIYQKKTWRSNFNKMVFKTDFEENNPGSNELGFSSKKRSVYTRKDISDIINTIENYENKYIKKIPNFHTIFNYQLGYKYYTKFKIMTSTFQNHNIKWLKLKSVNKRVCSAEDVFDAIHDAHDAVGHKKIASTFLKLQETYCNITEQNVKQCLKICFTCNLANDSKRKKHKGPGISIKSNTFRERIQVDLIDYQSDPRTNHNGVTMRWLMVVKDHFTKFMWLRPLKRKEGILVASELRLLFHEVGFPLIFHSDNGKEFINKEVYSLLKDYDPNTLMVRGAPRTPRHQGSVENGNQHIKTIIDKQIQVIKSNDSDSKIGWVDVLGPVTSAINSSVCYGNKKLTPYRHVFTQDYNFKYGIHDKDKYHLNTLEDVKLYLNTPISEIAPHSITQTNNDAQHDSKLLSSMEPQYDVISPPNSSNHDSNHSIQEESLESPCASIIEPQQIQKPKLRRNRRNIKYSMTYVLEHDPNSRKLINCEKTFDFVYASFNDEFQTLYKDKLFDSSINYCIGNPAYYKYCYTNDKRFWELDFLLLFGTLQAMSSSRNDILFIHNNEANRNEDHQVVSSSHQVDIRNKDIYVSVVYKSSHYGVIVYKSKQKEVFIYDGLLSADVPSTNNMWSNHILYVVNRVDNIVDLSQVQVHIQPIIFGTPVVMKQNDHYNCGPIACIVLWYIFNYSSAFNKQISINDKDLRKNIVEEMQRKINYHAHSMVAFGRERKQNLNKPTEILNKDQSNRTVANIEVNVSNLESPSNQIDESIKMQLIDKMTSNNKRKHTRKKHSNTLLKIRGRESSTCVGDIVTIRVPAADRDNWKKLNIIGIVFKVHFNKCSVLVVTEHGIITKNTNSKLESDYFIPPDKYEVLPKEASIKEILMTYLKQIQLGVFNPQGIKRISMSKVHGSTYGKVPKHLNVSNKCKCDNGNCKRICGCFRKDTKCNESCSCRGLCVVEKKIKTKACRCLLGYCNTNQCGCKKCTKTCSCSGKCKTKQRATMKSKPCRCRNNYCGKICGCKINSKSCTISCGCKGKCTLQQSSIQPPPVNLNKCYAVNEDNKLQCDMTIIKNYNVIIPSKTPMIDSPVITNNKIKDDAIDNDPNIVNILMSMKQTSIPVKNDQALNIKKRKYEDSDDSMSLMALIMKKKLKSDDDRSELSKKFAKFRSKQEILKPLLDLNASSSDSSKSSSINKDEYADLNLSSATGIYKVFKIPDSIEMNLNINDSDLSDLSVDSKFPDDDSCSTKKSGDEVDV